MTNFLKKILIITFILISIINFTYTISDPSDDNNFFEENLNDNYVQKITPSIIIRNLARIIGIIGFFLLGLTIFFGSSAKLFDKIFGLEKVLRFHKKFALYSIRIIALHPVLLFLSDIIDKTFSPDLYFYYLTYFPISSGIIAFIFFIITIVITYHFYKKINYYLWITLHRITIIFFMISAYHIMKMGILSGQNPKYLALNIFIFSGFGLTFAGIIIRIILIFLKKKKISEVLQIEKKTHDTTNLIIKRPDDFTYKAGQFCFISFINKKKLKTPHPFTISSSPYEKNLAFTIKSSGKFTSKIPEIIQNEKIKIDGPYGKFTLKNTNNKIVLIAGGVGITPFKSYLTNLLNSQHNTKIILFYGNKTKKDIIFYDWLEKIKNKLDLKIFYVLSNENIDLDNFKYGYITENILKKHIDFSQNDFYICGPPKMLKSILKILHKNHIKRKKIFFEQFYY